MAASGHCQLEFWLTDKLQSVSSDIDTDVFVSYIIGVLEEGEDDVQESVGELLSGVLEADLAKDVCAAIMEQWRVETDNRNLSQVEEDVGDKLSRMFEKQTLATVKEKKLSKEEADRKAAILAQYGQVSDGEESNPDELGEDESSTPSSSTAAPGGGKVKVDSQDSMDPLRVRNVNKEEVQRVEREKREKAKEEQEKKKEKDKQDRQTQKQKQQERKEAEKKRTQKGEKRR